VLIRLQRWTSPLRVSLQLLPDLGVAAVEIPSSDADGIRDGWRGAASSRPSE